MGSFQEHLVSVIGRTSPSQARWILQETNKEIRHMTYIVMLCTMLRGQSSVSRIAHLPVALSIATPKQAKEPIFPRSTTN